MYLRNQQASKSVKFSRVLLRYGWSAGSEVRTWLPYAPALRMWTPSTSLLALLLLAMRHGEFARPVSARRCFLRLPPERSKEETTLHSTRSLFLSRWIEPGQPLASRPSLHCELDAKPLGWAVAGRDLSRWHAELGSTTELPLSGTHTSLSL